MIHVPCNFNLYQSILCLNGALPHSEFFDQINLPIIAADGAVNILHAMKREPFCVIGDLDSVSIELRQKYDCIHIPDQDQSDFQKALEYLNQKKLLPAIILGVNGGHLDHILNNLNIFLKTDSAFYSPPIWGFVLQPSSRYEFNLMTNTKISLMGIPHAEVSSQGLKWELTRHYLSFPGAQSCFNRSARSQVLLEVHAGRVLALIYENQIQDAGGG